MEILKMLLSLVSGGAVVALITTWLQRRKESTQPIPLDNNLVSPERMEQFFSDIKAPLKVIEQERRKSLEVSAGFFDKLSALNAGSIAVSASIILAVLLKSETHPEWVRVVVHELLSVVGFLWLSLVLAILHNFLAAIVAKVATAQYEAEFVWTLTQHTISMAQETEPIDKSTYTQAKQAVREQLLPKERRLVKANRIIYLTVNIMGYLSMLMFLIAFTLVPVFLFRLW